MASRHNLRPLSAEADASADPSSPTASTTVRPGSDNPAADLRTQFVEKFNSWQKFWRTRRAIFTDLSLARRSKAELESGGLLSAWKFNLAQSAFSALPSLVVGKALSFIYPTPETPVELNGSMSFLQKVWAQSQPLSNQIFDVLWPAMVPFVLFLMARMIAWGSLKKISATPLRKEQARNAYLYLDGAYGFYPQLFAALGFALASRGGKFSFGPQSDFPEGAPYFVAMCYYAGIALSGTAAIWQGILNRWILAKKLFEFNGYSRKFKWFWTFRDKGRNLAPWNKYIFSFAYAVPVAILFISLSTLVVVSLFAFRIVGAQALGWSWLSTSIVEFSL
jgi:hypothetical protein